MLAGKKRNIKLKKMKWPLLPDHITNDGATNFKNSHMHKLNGLGIIPNDYLIGIVASITSRVAFPAYIAEFPIESNYPLVKTYPPDYHFQISPLRVYLGKIMRPKSISECEDSIFSLLRNANRLNIKETLEPSKQEKDNNLSIFLNEYLDRNIVEYDSPCIGYRNILFPIYIENKVVGVLSINDIVLEDRLNIIKKNQIESAIRNSENFIESEYPINRKDFINKIHRLNNDWLKSHHPINIKTEYLNLVHLCLKEVERLEYILSNTINQKREKYIVDKVDSYTKSLENNLPEETLTGDIGFEKIWKIVGQINDWIRNDFGLKFLFLFASRKYSPDIVEKLDLVAYSGKNPYCQVDKYHDLKFNISKLQEMKLEMSKTTKDTCFFECIDIQNIDHKKSFLKVYPVKYIPGCTILSWSGISRAWDPLVTNKQLASFFETTIRSYYSTLLTVLLSIYSKTSQAQAENALKIFGHEAGQLTSGLDWMRVLYFSDFERMKRLTDNKLKNIQKDFDGYLRQLSFLFEQTNLLVKPAKKPIFSIISLVKIVQKIRDIYHLELMNKKLKIISDFNSKANFFGDEAYAEILFYNLLNNAIKYSHKETDILINHKYTGNGGSKIDITNFGIKIEAGDQPYQLYYRGSESLMKDGLGIGLYTAKKIVQAHNGTITHFCNKTSKDSMTWKVVFEVYFPPKGDEL